MITAFRAKELVTACSNAPNRFQSFRLSQAVFPFTLIPVYPRANACSSFWFHRRSACLGENAPPAKSRLGEKPICEPTQFLCSRQPGIDHREGQPVAATSWLGVP